MLRYITGYLLSIFRPEEQGPPAGNVLMQRDGSYILDRDGNYIYLRLP